jgi:maltooligosyltrehalose trehalohydrolase
MTILRSRAVSEGRRREFAVFGWDPAEVADPQDPATFEASRLDWSEPGRAPHADLLSWHRALIAARRALPGLCGHDLGTTRAAYTTSTPAG